MLETNEEDEDDENYSGAIHNNYTDSIMLYDDKNTKLSEAQDMLDDLVDRFERYKRGDYPIPEEDKEEDVMEEKKKIEDEQEGLKRRLQEQEDNLKEIMKEIEEKEALLQKAVEENNKFLAIEGEMNEDGELSSQAAALKFSSMRGNAYKLPTSTNTDIPHDKVIEELPEEDDEEMSRLEEMLQDAQHFNEEFEAAESQKQILEESLKSSEDIYLGMNDNYGEIREADLKEEEDMADYANPNE